MLLNHLGILTGHESTNYEKWLNSVTSYTVDYKEEFEPYILCSRRLIPWYDERFTGYGKNKVILTSCFLRVRCTEMNKRKYSVTVCVHFLPHYYSK